MFNRLTHRTTAFGLAAIVTLAMLVGVDELATQAPAEAAIAASTAPVADQIVVVTGHREPRS